LTPPGLFQTGWFAALAGIRGFQVRKSPYSETGGSFMGIDSIIVWLIVGAIAGWLAGLIVKGAGFGLVGNIVVGIIGAVVAGWLLPQLGVHLGSGIVAAIVNSAIGGVIVLVILALIRRA